MHERKASSIDNIPKATDPEGDIRKPFIIRGHHLPKYSRLIKGYFDQEGFLVRGPIFPLDGSIKHLTFYRRTLRALKREEVPDTEEIQEINKMIGKTGVQHLKFLLREWKLYREFKALPDNAPLHIVAGRKDEFCLRCPLHNDHCEQESGDMYGPHGQIIFKSRTQRDKIGVEIFIREAKRLGFSEESGHIRSFEAMTDYTNVPNSNLTHVRTTAGVVKAVLQKSRDLNYPPQ